MVYCDGAFGAVTLCGCRKIMRYNKKDIVTVTETAMSVCPLLKCVSFDPHEKYKALGFTLLTRRC